MSELYTNLYMDYLKFKAFLKNQKHFKLLRTLKKEQWLNIEQIERLQVERLRGLIEHATNNSEFYREKYAGIKPPGSAISSVADLQRLPLLTRDDLQQNYERMLCPLPGAKTYADSSGGSTGNPVNFYHDNIYKTYADAFDLLFFSWHGLTRGDRTAIFWGADRDFRELSFKERLMIKLARVKLLNSFDVDEKKLDDFLAEIQAFRPTYIYGYASSLELAAKYINDSGKYTIRPKAIRSSAEMLYSSQRREIERAFDAPVYNFYGSREINNIAAECPSCEGLHVFASGRIVEVVDKKGNQLPDGENGDLAITDLTSLSFPFIRYLIGDMGIRKKEKCSCGRGYPLLENITGRSSDIITIGGKYTHGEYFTHLFYGRPEVERFQVVQETDDRLVVKIMTGSEEMDTRDIEEKIRSKVGEEAVIQIEFVEHIPPLKSGKYRFTINNTAR